MKSALRGWTGTGTTYVYDAQGRVTEMRERNFWSDKVKTTSYNDQGDKAEERTNFTGNAVLPIGVPFSIDENGTLNLIPSEPAAEPPASPPLPAESNVRYSYQYDSYGNWTQQTVNLRSTPDETSYDRYRKLTYY